MQILSFCKKLSTKEVENIWKSQWKGAIIFAMVFIGVLVLVKYSLKLELKSTAVDENGHYILLDVTEQSSSHIMGNIYAPNKNRRTMLLF